MPSCFIPVSSCQSQGLISLLPPSGASWWSATFTVIFPTKALKTLYVMKRQEKKIPSHRQQGSFQHAWLPAEHVAVVLSLLITLRQVCLQFSHIRQIPFSWLRRGARHKQYHEAELNRSQDKKSRADRTVFHALSFPKQHFLFGHMLPTLK